MKNRYSISTKISASQADWSSRLRFDSILGLMQDVTTYHSDHMGISHVDIMEKSNAFWVVSKIKFKVSGDRDTFQKIFTAETWPHKPGALRYVRDFRVTSDTTLIEGRSEWCILDCDTLAIRKTDSVVYPEGLVHDEERTSVSDFIRLRERVGEEHFRYTYRTVLTDIDCNAHVNNLAYARMAMNSFAPDELDGHAFNAFEVHFVSQTFFGDEIAVYRRTAEIGGEYVEGRIGERVVFKALLYNE